MKHLKKFNENISQELDFEDFKLILEVDIEDQFSNIELSFHDYSNEEDPFFDCHVNLPPLNLDIYPEDISFSYNYLMDIIPDYDSPESINDEGYPDTIPNIEYQISKLEKAKLAIDDSIRAQKKIVELFSVLLNKTTPRLKEFSNCLDVTFGMDLETLRICFEINNDEGYDGDLED
jgi:hypothetical protein